MYVFIHIYINIEHTYIHPTCTLREFSLPAELQKSAATALPRSEPAFLKL